MSPRALVTLVSALLALSCVGDDGAGESTSETGGTTSSGGTTAGTSGSTTSESTTTTTTTATTATTSSTGAAETAADIEGFERFKIATETTRCPRETECDAFLELLAGGTLRIKRFGDEVSDIVVAQVSDADFLAAASIFADPALLARLDDPGLRCEAPFDLAESMRVDVSGVTHEASTSGCDDPSINAAREMAASLEATYAP